jgi:hypothetical protein
VGDDVRDEEESGGARGGEHPPPVHRNLQPPDRAVGHEEKDGAQSVERRVDGGVEERIQNK